MSSATRRRPRTTGQNWIVSGSVLVNTTAFSSTYDQQQWANAFGISNLAARVDRTFGGPHSLHVWFHGDPPRADDNIGVINQRPADEAFPGDYEPLPPR